MQASWLWSQGGQALGDIYRIGRAAARYFKDKDFSLGNIKSVASNAARTGGSKVATGTNSAATWASTKGLSHAKNLSSKAKQFATTNTRTRNISIALGAGAIGYGTSNKDASTGEKLGRGLAFATMGTYGARIANYNRSSFKIAGQALGDRAYGEAFAALKQGLEMPTKWGLKHSIAAGAFYGMVSTETSVMQGAAFGGIAHVGIKGDTGSVGSRPLRYHPKRAGEPLRLTAGGTRPRAVPVEEMYGPSTLTMGPEGPSQFVVASKSGRVGTMRGPEGTGQFSFTPSKPVFDPVLNARVGIASGEGRWAGTKAAQIASKTYSKFNIRTGARIGMVYGAYRNLENDDPTGLSVVGGAMKGAAMGVGLVGAAKAVKNHTFASIAAATTIIPFAMDVKEASNTIQQTGAPGFDTLNADGDLALALHKMRHS